MSSCVTELGDILQSMLTLKPPGVSSTKIKSIAELCNANIQSETVLIQKLYTHFKKAPGPYKLGVLYVVDSVTRQWVDQARKQGQPAGSTTSDGTFSAGVQHVTELLPSFMTDIISNSPEEQKDKIKKLIDIWERGNTFPAHMLLIFKEKLNAPISGDVSSTTPQGTPPQDFIPLNPPNQPAPSAPAVDTSAILANLQALANLSKQTSTAPVSTGQQSSAANNVTYPFSQNGITPVNVATPVPPPAQVNPAGGFAYPGVNYAQAPLPGNNLQTVPSNQGNAPNVAPDTLQQQLQIITVLRAQGIPQEQWSTVLNLLMPNNNGNSIVAPNPPNFGVPGTSEDQSRDRNAYDYRRSPPGRYRNPRSRSRSPQRWDRDRRREASPPRRRDSPVYGDYGNDRNGNRGDSGRRGGIRGRGNDYRQRSPNRFRNRSPSPRRQDLGMPLPGPKPIKYDSSLGEGMIKVLSRTLFVGGVTSSEDDLRAIFAKFGRVQTCIVNVDKRHAFVKMISREEAIVAKEGMEHHKSTDMQLRTRWGVGFGPRDCSDYQTGISIIPIERLTDADRKWLLTAEYGGTGGKPIESGLVVEEPDIEIGAGVSSKAISRRMQTDKGGQQGPRSTRDGPPPSRFRQPEGRGGNDRDTGAPPAVPGFGFQFPVMANGMAMFPPGFVMPSGQPPPPGAN